MKRLMCTMASVALMVSMASGETVIWYHFNEGEIGTQPKSSATQAVVVNAANPGTHDARVARMGGSGVIYGDSQRLPTYAATFDEDQCWKDPVSGACGTDNKGFYCNTETTDARGVGSIVVADDDASLHLQAMTAELFIKPDGTPTYEEQFCQLNNGSSLAWQIRMNQSGKLYVYYQKPDLSIGYKNFNNPTLIDGRWHHVAITYDGSKLRGYADYVLYVELEVSQLVYADNPANAKLTLGASDLQKDYGRYRGHIDEFRLSDKALAPSDFLHVIPTWIDADTLVYIPCGPTAISAAGNDVNAAASGIPAVATTMSSSSPYPAPVSDVPSATFRNGMFATDSHADETSYRFVSSETYAGRSSRIAIDDVVNGQHALMAQPELTFEFFFKPEAAKTLWAAHFAAGGANQLYILSDGKIRGYLYDKDSNGASVTYTSSKAVLDNQWHHLAVVADAAKRELYIYLDYLLDATFSNFVFEPSAYSSTSYYKDFSIGASYNDTQNNGYAGWMDEIRITKRALLPREFLTSDLVERPQVPAPTVFYAPLDGSGANYPFPNLFAENLGEYKTTYVDRVPGQTIPEKETMGLAVTNLCALELKQGGGYIGFGRQRSLEGLDTMTIEFFARLRKDEMTPSDWPAVLRMDSKISGTGSIMPFWAIGLDGSQNLHVRMDNEQKTGQYISFDTQKIYDGKWHHVAATLEKKMIDNVVKTEVHMYVDGEEAALAKAGGTRYMDGCVVRRFATKDGNLYLGTATGSSGKLVGRLDEIRISNRVLAPAEFLHAVRNPTGCVIILR